MKFAGVIVDISHEKLDKTFQYIIPDELESSIQIGSLVEIPFGKSRRRGYVVEITDKPELELEKLKAVTGIVDNSVTIDGKLIRLAYWMKTNYGSTINQALKTVVPVKEKVREENKKTVHLLVSVTEAASLKAEADLKRRKAQSRLLEALIENPVTDYALLTQKLNISPSTIRTMEEKGIIELESITVFRNTINVNSVNKRSFALNDEQQSVINDINTDIDNGVNDTCLIKGVTGSGKTEVYMEIIDHVLQQGREAIVLIPEIALTYQTVMRFYNRFGDKVSIINSRLSKGEKYDRFLMARQGKIKIMIGPRSALFTPFQKLGLIVIDEEHEGAYKSETVPRYHARETAVELARMNNAKVILGSATPSLEAYYNALNGSYKLYTLNNRAGSGTIPTVDIVDLREEMKKGNRSIFSDRLMELMNETLSRGEQAMLFLNRRGYQGFINCRDCGNVISCPHCAVSLTQHRGGRLVCHYCGYEQRYTGICPKCGSKHIGTFKAGTEKVEEETRRCFPNAGILRMDLDTTRGKDGHEKILEQFANHEADILIGTQMIVKGHDFPDVTMVGILLADMSLYSSDYMASERTFELLTQAAGRAGRANKPGKVVIQTYAPDNYSIIHAAAQDYDSFYNEEIAYRDLMDYPPVEHMMSVRIASDKEQCAIASSIAVKKLTDSCGDKALKTIGPADAPIYKINDVYYRMIYYKHKDYHILTIIKDMIETYSRTDDTISRYCQIQFDFR